MTAAPLLLLLLCSSVMTASAARVNSGRWGGLWRRDVPQQGFYNPWDGGGNFLATVANTEPADQIEPLNIVISAHSSPEVLVDEEVGGGLRNYFLSFDFSGECLGQHQGDPQKADLGDGKGRIAETAVIRYNFKNPQVGTCQESIDGGNHFRFWVQNGPNANSGAIFMATSSEMSLAQGHRIVTNGYNLGRDYLLSNITGTHIDTLALSSRNTSFFASYSLEGTTVSGGYTYHTSIAYVPGFLRNSSIGVNHNETVRVSGRNGTVISEAVDGLLAVLTVTITGRPANGAASARLSNISLIGALACMLALFMA